MEEFKYKVYIKLDRNNCITDVASSIQEIDFTDWTEIDEGTGDKYAHAQGNYFDVKNGEKPLRDSQSRCNYKYVNNEVVVLSDEEKESLFPTPVQQPTETELLKQQLLETQAQLAEMQYNILLNGGIQNV